MGEDVEAYLRCLMALKSMARRRFPELSDFIVVGHVYRVEIDVQMGDSLVFAGVQRMDRRQDKS